MKPLHPVRLACAALIACAATYGSIAAQPAENIESLRERATALAAESVVRNAIDDATIALFAERAVIRVEDAGRISRAKYAGLAACGVKSWQAAAPAVEREMLVSVVDGRLVRSDAMGYRAALADGLDADRK